LFVRIMPRDLGWPGRGRAKVRSSGAWWAGAGRAAVSSCSIVGEVWVIVSVVRGQKVQMVGEPGGGVFSVRRPRSVRECGKRASAGVFWE